MKTENKTDQKQAVLITGASTEIGNATPEAQYPAGPGAKKMKMLARFPRAMRDNMLYKEFYN